MPQSKYPTEQQKWLVEKFPIYRTHHFKKTLKQFFPALYREFFAIWPPTPDAEDIGATGGNIAAATAVVRAREEMQLYRWFYNRTQSKNGVSGEGSSAGLNLTAGPPKKKAAVQTYVKHYWASKIRQEVINRWAPTLETDLYDEADIGEDQVAWEELTPMEKDIPLSFRMKIGRELYTAETDEVKAEIDRLREKEKEVAVALHTATTTFTTDKERLQAMKKFDDNFSKLGNSLRNLSSNVLRDFGFHTSIIVGGPIVRENGRLGVYTYESGGTPHKQLTFSEFLEESYDSEVSGKFVEYLKLCFPKGDRQLYTLSPVTAAAETPSSGVPAPKPSLEARTSGPIRSQCQTVTARMRTGPMSAALKARILGYASSKTSKAKEASTRMAVTLPTEAEYTDLTVPTHSNLTNHALYDRSSPSSHSSTGTPDSIPCTPASLDLSEAQTDGSPPPESDDMSVDEEVLTETTTASVPCDSVIEVNFIPSLGVSSLVQTSLPTLLFIDEDERPDWLLISIKDFLRHMPYYSCLDKVVDLFLAQESRLGYPAKSKRLALPCVNRPQEVADYMKFGRDFARGDYVDAATFGAQVIQWWCTIQPTTRKCWPPTYGSIPENFSFDYFNRGGPNGVFLVIICLLWWANALSPGMDYTDFQLVVQDVRWVLEQISSRA